MSLLNIGITPDRALLSVDTAISFMSGGNGLCDMARETVCHDLKHTTKIDFISHLGAAYASRGDALAANMGHNALRLSPPQTFDEAVTAMPDVLDIAYTQALEYRAKLLGINEPQGVEVVLVGWSPAQYRMDAWHWSRYPGDGQFKRQRVTDALLLPGARWNTTPARPDDAQAMEAIARAEVDYVREEHPDMVVGGKLLLAELTQEGFSLRTIADLEA